MAVEILTRRISVKNDLSRVLFHCTVRLEVLTEKKSAKSQLPPVPKCRGCTNHYLTF